jgi:hypothetical protein
VWKPHHGVNCCYGFVFELLIVRKSIRVGTEHVVYCDVEKLIATARYVEERNLVPGFYGFRRRCPDAGVMAVDDLGRLLLKLLDDERGPLPE